MGPMRENETFYDFAQLKKDLGEIATPSESLIVIAKGIKGTGLIQRYKPASSWPCFFQLRSDITKQRIT